MKKADALGAGGAPSAQKKLRNVVLVFLLGHAQETTIQSIRERLWAARAAVGHESRLLAGYELRLADGVPSNVLAHHKMRTGRAKRTFLDGAKRPELRGLFEFGVLGNRPRSVLLVA